MVFSGVNNHAERTFVIIDQNVVKLIPVQIHQRFGGKVAIHMAERNISVRGIVKVGPGGKGVAVAVVEQNTVLLDTAAGESAHSDHFPHRRLILRPLPDAAPVGRNGAVYRHIANFALTRVPRHNLTVAVGKQIT